MFLSGCAGVDYSVKSITVDNSQVALQMWDTAGQERWGINTKNVLSVDIIYKSLYCTLTRQFICRFFPPREYFWILRSSITSSCFLVLCKTWNASLCFSSFSSRLTVKSRVLISVLKWIHLNKFSFDERWWILYFWSCSNISTVKIFLICEVPVNTQHYFFLSSSSSSTTCRYRSITKQFFRKADGVVVMYDITAQQSFTAVRQWLTSVKVR